MSPNETDMPESIERYLQPFRGIKAVIGLAAAVTYPLGYLVWALNATQNNLGYLPALNSQYIIAGIAPVLIGTIGFFAGRIFQSFALTKWPQLITSDALWATLLRIASRCLFLASFLIILIYELLPDSWAIVKRTALYTLVGTLIVGPPIKGYEILQKIYRWVWVYFSIVSFVVITLAFYIDIVYPSWPRAVGGIRPECVHLDLAKRELAPGTLTAIAPKDALNTSLEIVRSRPLDLYFNTDNIVIVKLHGSDRKTFPFRLNASAVKNTSACTR